MIESEARELTAMVMDFWPSKFHWTPPMVGLWVEKFNRREWDRRQCEAVIRDQRTQDDGAKPSLRRILARCFEVHKAVKAKDEPRAGEVVTAEEWAVIHRDREAVAAWWYENKHNAAEIVKQATAAYPMFITKFNRFMDPEFKPAPLQCMTLKCGWERFQSHGKWQGKGYGPLMSGLVGAIG